MKQEQEQEQEQEQDKLPQMQQQLCRVATRSYGCPGGK
jgi:hypothetical protein